MEIKIRQEILSDYKDVAKIIEEAFKNEQYSDQKEHLLVEKLRKSEVFIPELSLVAENNGSLVGHILLTKLKVINESETYYSLALAPVSVHPIFQGKGIGKKLILESHKLARTLGYRSIILLGHQDYYPKFGYQLANSFNIQLPFDVPDENCMAIELIKGSLSKISGLVEYPSEFYE